MNKKKRGNTEDQTKVAKFQKRTVLAMANEMADAKNRVDRAFLLYTALANSMGITVAAAVD